jgi:hypothetical protein
MNIVYTHDTTVGLEQLQRIDDEETLELIEESALIFGYVVRKFKIDEKGISVDVLALVPDTPLLDELDRVKQLIIENHFLLKTTERILF